MNWRKVWTKADLWGRYFTVFLFAVFMGWVFFTILDTAIGRPAPRPTGYFDSDANRIVRPTPVPSRLLIPYDRPIVFKDSGGGVTWELFNED